jgi:MFS family permease
VVTGIAYTLGSVIAGYGSDRWGRKPFMIAPMILGAIATIPTFWLMNQWPSATTLFTLSFLLRFVMAMAALASFVAITEAFPARMRSGGVAVVYAIATSVFGGTTQFVIAWLTGVTGNPLSPAWYMLGAILVGLVAMLLMRETAPVKTGEAG